MLYSLYDFYITTELKKSPGVEKITSYICSSSGSLHNKCCHSYHDNSSIVNRCVTEAQRLVATAAIPEIAPPAGAKNVMNFCAVFARRPTNEQRSQKVTLSSTLTLLNGRWRDIL